MVSWYSLLTLALCDSECACSCSSNISTRIFIGGILFSAITFVGAEVWSRSANLQSYIFGFSEVLSANRGWLKLCWALRVSLWVSGPQCGGKRDGAKNTNCWSGWWGLEFTDLLCFTVGCFVFIFALLCFRSLIVIEPGSITFWGIAITDFGNCYWFALK